MWFARGVQSAVFYYVSLSPCMEAKRKRKRRKEARDAAKERAELELSQPETIRQPMQFQTNKYWAEEIAAGPGPPKGWKKHIFEDETVAPNDSRKKRSSPTAAISPPQTAHVRDPTAVRFSEVVQEGPKFTEEPSKSRPSTAGQSTDHKPTAARGTFRDTIKSSLSPETWNLKRYERDDEPLWGLNDTISRMWDRARPSHLRRESTAETGEKRRSLSLSRGRKRSSAEGEQYDYYRARHPAVNDLHPPVVSQLPAARAEVAWMLQPPPSRAVMEGKTRPRGEEMRLRKPLAIIGSSKEEDRKRAMLPEDLTGLTERSEAGASRKKRLESGIGVNGDGVDEEVHEEGEDGDREDSEDDEADYRGSPGRSQSLPPIRLTRPPAAVLKKPPSWQPLRAPLTTITSGKTPTSLHSLTIPLSSSGLNSPSSSPGPSYCGKQENGRETQEGDGTVSPDFEYLVGVVMREMPAGTRRSLPSGVWV